MNIKPINDGSDFDSVELKTSYPNTNPTPHCKKHGAMNKVSSYNGGGYWRCIHTVSQTQDNTCRTGCVEQS